MRVNRLPADPRYPEQRLLDFLRDDLGLTSVKEGCGMGECGACTVLVNGEAMCGCLLLVGQVADKDIVTAEGVSALGLEGLREALVDAHGIQCGYCTPGIVMSLAALMSPTARPSEEEVEESLVGNLCRCTGYAGIVRAARAVLG